MEKKKINNLLIGTNNRGKLREIRSLLPKSLKTYSILDFKIKSPVENGKSFRENSLIKSKYFSKKTNLICLADDSGLEIDLLNKRPGIYSARWGGKKNNFKKAIKKVYTELEKIDIKTFFYLKNSVIYYDITRTDDLIKNLKFLITNPSEINKMKKKISENKNNFLKSWKQRIKEEKNILFDL